MEPKSRRKYTKEFQIDALNLAKEISSYSEAARRLGISDSLLHSWKNKYKFSMDIKSKTPVQLVAETDEMKRLRKENEELKKVNYILKKAAAFFSQDHLK